MCEFKENNTFVKEGDSVVFQINKQYLEGKVTENEVVRCGGGCGEIAIGYDELGIPWCYEPDAHPDQMFPMVTEIVYEIKQTA